MAVAVIMPRQGQSVESCIIAKWHKNKGDKVSIGDVLFTYETDKATFDEESKVDGVMLETFFEEGDDVECLINVCVIGNEGEDISEFLPSGQEAQEEKQIETQVKVEEVVEQAVVQTLNTDDFMKISPRAKSLLSKSGADVRFAIPSGPNGRIIERDIQKVIDSGKVATPAALNEYMQVKTDVVGTGIGGRITTADLLRTPQTSASDFEEVKHTNIRKVIAKAMHSSLANSAQLTLNSSFDATDILELRKKLKVKAEELGLPNITITDIIVYAVSRTLVKFKVVNSHYFDDKLVIFNNANVGVAVDTPRGLMVPTIFEANKMTLSQISNTAKAVFAECKQGTISPDNLKGGTFTISNLGTFGIESFTPVLNPPQTGILGVCSTIERTKNGKVYPAMGLSLTFDHRAFDGADAAKFLKELVSNLENFSAMMVN
jgi:pyruvate dehydrogenase E2 component (dihydrolipoamide acetyltransferase)